MSTSVPELQAGLDWAIDSAVSEQRLVGCAVMVSHGGERVYERAAGYADRESGAPFTPATIVRLASVTKVIVSVAALRLVDQGVIKLDDPVTAWMPAFRPALPDGGKATILLRHLLTHTSGLGYRFFQPPGGPYELAGISDGVDSSGGSLEDQMARLAALPLLAPPGSVWIYSLSTDVLGAVLQAATGLPLPDVMRSIVCEPLGMQDTGFTVTDTSRLTTPYVNGLPQPHRLAEDELVTSLEWGDAAGIRFAPSRIHNHDAFPSGGAGMAGTAGDVLTLLEAVRLDARDGAGRVLSHAMANSLFVGQIGKLEVGPGITYSFAAAVVADPVRARTPQSVDTAFWSGGYGHTWFVDPVRELSVVAITNTLYEGESGRFPLDIRDAIYRDTVEQTR